MRLLLAVLVLGVGCSTPYQKNEGLLSRGGFSEERLGPDMWGINVGVNSYTSRTTAVTYAWRRAAELCPGGFDPVAQDADDGFAVTPQYDARTMSWRQSVSKKPGAFLVVRCHPYTAPAAPREPTPWDDATTYAECDAVYKLYPEDGKGVEVCYDRVYEADGETAEH
jgi:hypothetical protein